MQVFMMHSGTIFFFIAQINCNFNAPYKKNLISSSGMFKKVISNEVIKKIQRTYLTTGLKNQRPKTLLCVFNYGLD